MRHSVTLSEMTLAAKRAAYVRRLEEAVERIRTVLADVPGMRRVSLFGSYAKGRRDLFTDLDLFVVWDTDRSLLERQRYLYSLLSLPVDLDIVCYTPAELAAAADSPLNLHLRQDEVVLFEPKPA
jgi:predicted nucleotidyltransferase